MPSPLSEFCLGFLVRPAISHQVAVQCFIDCFVLFHHFVDLLYLMTLLYFVSLLDGQQQDRAAKDNKVLPPLRTDDQLHSKVSSNPIDPFHQKPK